jgi:hypothetical protein
MTTTAQAVPVLEVSAPDDDMDVLSDTAFDFGDGDIDLDLDTAPSVHDDDMSLNDAATDGGLDLQGLPTDQDDFMADHGDLIEEDDVYDGDAATAAELQTVDDGTITVEADMLAPPDEDLIDYSDDEGQQPLKMQSPSMHEEEGAQASYEVEAISPAADTQEDMQVQEEVQSLAPADASHDGVESHQDYAPEILRHEASSPHVNPELQPQSAVEPQLDGDDEEPAHADNDDGGVLLSAEEHSHSDDENAVQPQADAQQTSVEAKEDGKDQQIELRPITVNYAGNELWLFKQHDIDNSGDWLLEDLSVAKSSISGVFQACRASLGDDVSSEHEIGFRFDHLHNLELYEDNTACVAVSLERLVDLYHTLQAQDNNEDPECFYITLQFRPRFATLLADVVQYAEQGSGYCALDAAVAAGETHFTNLFSSASTEHEHVDWEDEDNEDGEPDSPDSVHSTAPQGTEADDLDEQQFVEVDEQQGEHREDQDQDEEQQQEGVALEEDSHQTQDTQDEEPHDVQETANIDSLEKEAPLLSTEQHDVVQEPEPEPEPEPELETEAVPERQTSEPHDERTPDQIAHDKQEADDFVDYSDDEDGEEVKSVPAHAPSPSSATIQGDEPTEVQDSGPVTEPNGHDGEDAAETGFEAGHEDDTTLHTDAQYGDDANEYSYQDYAETYDQAEPFQDFQADSTEEDPFEADDTLEGDANQDFAGYDFQTLEENVNPGFDSQAFETHDGGDNTFDDVTDADGFLDFDNAPEWATDAEPTTNLPEDTVLLHDDDTTYKDEEDGVVDQTATTTSSAADLALASSNEHKASSPQGQKRSIDEVGEGIDDAPDSTGMPIPPSPYKRRRIADLHQTPRDPGCETRHPPSLSSSLEY